VRPDLTVEIVRVGDAAVVSPYGEIDIATAAKVQDALEQARGARVLIFDLRGVEFIDTSGLRLIIAERQRAEHDGYGFAVVRGSGQVQKLLAVAGYPHDDSFFVNDPGEFMGGGRA
jgi:anti-sigma B factor antagonist